jgi:hypothetical protein
MNNNEEESDEQEMRRAVKDLCKFLRYLFIVFLVGGVVTFCYKLMVSKPSPAQTQQKNN